MRKDGYHEIGIQYPFTDLYHYFSRMCRTHQYSTGGKMKSEGESQYWGAYHRSVRHEYSCPLWNSGDELWF